MTRKTNKSTERSERHQYVLEQAMGLIAERGFAAASLRELARRVNLSQPSLYHYFDTKEQLIGQILEMHTARMLSALERPPVHKSLADCLKYLLGRILTLYSRPEQVTFIRFSFAVTVEKPDFGTQFKRVLVDRLPLFTRPQLMPFVHSGDLAEQDVEPLLALVINSLVLKLIHERVLFRETLNGEECSSFVEFIVNTVLNGILCQSKGSDS